MAIQTIKWSGQGVRIIDQTLLPAELKYIHCQDLKTLWKAIKELKVRGAPALGVAAAFGIVLAAQKFKSGDRKKFLIYLKRSSDYLASSRPTAVNLFNALEDMKKVLNAHRDLTVAELKIKLKERAFAIYEADRRVCRKMGDYGARLINPGSTVMTVCNAGALATVDYGTALGVMYSAKARGRKFKVYACETRPLLQGARLTTWELLKEGIDTTLICDNMAASLMQKKKVDAIFTGADRIAANGDTANKIGTYNLAVLAKYHRVPFYIVAPFSTFDLKIDNGSKIPIEERDKNEVLGFRQVRTAPQGAKVYNPAFDVTGHPLISAIVTEYGIIKSPNAAKIRKMFRGRSRT